MKQEKFKLLIPEPHHPNTKTYINLDQIIIEDANYNQLTVEEFINSLTLVLKTLEIRLEALDGIKSK